MSWLLVLITFLLASIKTTKNDKPSVAVVIPAYNEEETVANIVKIAKSLEYVTEVVVVNDGSNDNTEEEAKNAGAKVINHQTNKGKGAALKTGFKNTTSDIIAFIDADIYNLTKNKLNAIIEPILKNQTDLTKTKFARESGRVTELTAKPLIKFFFPEINFEQPLSGQFAGKRTALNKIKFEEDYGVDVGIVLDADIQGIKTEEIDIGDIKHDMSPLSDLHQMANEVVRTIINRAVNYGRITMMDTLGNYIRWGVVGLSLIILGIFTLFFVTSIPLQISMLIIIIGTIIAIYFTIHIIIKLSKFFKKGSRKTLIKSFINMHFSFIVCGAILLLMISTFLSAATINDGAISIEPASRNLIIFPHSENNQPLSIRGPYTIDSAIENESNIIRFPEDALTTMQISQGDTIKIGNTDYTINNTRENEGNTFRIPQEARNQLQTTPGEIISNSKLNDLFEGCTISHKINSTNLTNYTLETNFIINTHKTNQTNIEITKENQTINTLTGSFNPDSTYTITLNGHTIKQFKGQYAQNNETITFQDNGEQYTIKFTNQENQTTTKEFITTNTGPFLEFYKT